MQGEGLIFKWGFRLALVGAALIGAGFLVRGWM